VIPTFGEYVVVALNKDADLSGSIGRLRIFHCNELMPWPGAKPTAEKPPEYPQRPDSRLPSFLQQTGENR
jgi:hypothetical protein